MTLNISHYLAVNVPRAHILPKDSRQLDVSMTHETIPKSLHVACCLISMFPNHPLGMNTPTILNDSTSRNPVHLDKASVEARQLSHLYLCIDQKTIQAPDDNDTEM
jgi:hypothetical protein